jgi:hypothetical protein
MSEHRVVVVVIGRAQALDALDSAGAAWMIIGEGKARDACIDSALPVLSGAGLRHGRADVVWLVVLYLDPK